MIPPEAEDDTTVDRAVWKIYWNDYMMDAYNYGSEITFHSRDNVEVYNRLVPPGTVIKSWHSKTNFQSNRIEPSLPIIDGESSYRIEIDITEEGNPTVPGYMLRIVYYDRYDAEAGSNIIRQSGARFKCPLKTYSYDIQLICAGCTRFNFHSITIAELEEDDEEKQKAIQNSGRGKKTH